MEMMFLLFFLKEKSFSQLIIFISFHIGSDNLTRNSSCPHRLLVQTDLSWGWVQLGQVGSLVVEILWCSNNGRGRKKWHFSGIKWPPLRWVDKIFVLVVAKSWAVHNILCRSPRLYKHTSAESKLSLLKP